jgi:hypothetical protein
MESIRHPELDSGSILETKPAFMAMDAETNSA